MAETPTVLVIDDDPWVRMTFKRSLERAGLATIEADSGEQGLERMRADPPDAVLLDLHMPGISGAEVLAIAVQEQPHTPIIMATGDGTVDNAIDALRGGAWDFVVKPLRDPELLVHAVRRALEKSQLRRENARHQAEVVALNAQLRAAVEELRADQEAGRALQRQLLPKPRQRFGAYELNHRLFASQYLSGDFVDYFAIGGDHVGFYVADVAGHGAASAFVTTMLTTFVRGYLDAHASGTDDAILSPKTLLARLNEDLLARRIDTHVCMLYGVIDRNAHRTKMSNAAFFPYPMLRRSGGGVDALERPGRPLGLFSQGAYQEFEVRFDPDDALLLASDGVLEVGDAPQAERIATMLGALSASDDLGPIAASLGLDGSGALRDDAALLMIRRLP